MKIILCPESIAWPGGTSVVVDTACRVIYAWIKLNPVLYS